MVASALVAGELASQVPTLSSDSTSIQHQWKWPGDWFGFDEPADEIVVPRAIEQTELRRQFGDDPRWADPSWDDQRWEVVHYGSAIPANAGIVWLRFRVRTRDPAVELPRDLRIGTAAAYELYWDGELVLRSGKVGTNRAEEIPGNTQEFAIVPAGLLGPKVHTVALRLSTYHYNRPSGSMGIGIYNLHREIGFSYFVRQLIEPIATSGALLVIGMAVLLVWLISVHRPVMLRLAILCLTGGLVGAAHIGREVLPVPYSWSYPLWISISVGTFAFGALLANIVLQHFDVPRRRLVVAGLILTDLVALVVFPEIDGIHLAIGWAAMLFVSVTAAGWALWRRKEGAFYVLAGLGISGAIFAFDPIVFSLSRTLLKLGPALAALFVALALRLRRDQREAREARLTAGRLEIELLKKSLQPHFLMNTLTTLAQAVDEDPTIAAKLIDDLAGVMRSIAGFADRKLIRLAEELELCRAHLRVMSIRTEQPWQLRTAGENPEALVPPGLFLTLIENGFAHQKVEANTGSFSLRAERSPRGVRYEFHSPGRIRNHQQRTDGGTGLRYVKARLEEAYPGNWTLEQSETPGGWSTIITINDRAGGATNT